MERIGRYEILEEVGRGGFGRVYRGFDPLMKREVAIKLMMATDQPGMLGRFRNEAASAGNLHNPAIVTVYDLGEDHSQPFIVMEYLRGQNLQEVLDRRVPLSPVEKLRILCQIASGLQTAHENGIVHRDAKPANIMVLKDGTVKITDFGIALLNREGVTRHTETGYLVGTLQYLPPELFAGHEADAFADLWAFGVIAYQLLAGRSPFNSPDPAQLMYLITNAVIPALCRVSPATPPELGAAVDRMLQRERAARFQSFDDIRVELNPILERLEALEATRQLDEARVLAARDGLLAARDIVRQVLERSPSNKEARELRDKILAELRAGEARAQAQNLLKTGDVEMLSGNYQGAVNAYEQASRMLPGSPTALQKLEHARQLAKEGQRRHDELHRAKASLAAGAVHEALSIAKAVLESDPENQEALRLQEQIQGEVDRRRETRAAEAILLARDLAASERDDEAISVLTDAEREIGEHRVIGEAKEELLRRIAERHAMLTLEAELQKREHAAAAARDAGHRAEVIGQALARSRELGGQGKPEEAIRVLDTALFLYPDAPDLIAERRRLSEPARPSYDRPPSGTGPPRRPEPLDTVILPVRPKPEIPPAAEGIPEKRGETIPANRYRMPGPKLRAGIAALLVSSAGGTYWWIHKPARIKPIEIHQNQASNPPQSDLNPATVKEQPIVADDRDVIPIREKARSEPESKPAKKSEERLAVKKSPEEEHTVETGKKPTGGDPLSSNPGPSTLPLPDSVGSPASKPQPSEPPVEPVAEWLGPKRGRVTWKGNLPPGGRLVLSARGVREGGGDIVLGSLPTVDMSVVLDPPDANLHADGSARHVVIVNNGPTAVAAITFTWSLK
ncbi:MAG TPA: protein kinase [Bryobacteraceae bacterium]|nr:protein kinase [Bryobacteraceae bacterium]